MQKQTSVPGAEIALEGAVNFRELGGYPAADGRTVRYGLLYRGGNLDVLQSPADRAVLESVLNDAQQRFEMWYEQMMRRQARTAY